MTRYVNEKSVTKRQKMRIERQAITTAYFGFEKIDSVEAELEPNLISIDPI